MADRIQRLGAHLAVRETADLLASTLQKMTGAMCTVDSPILEEDLAEVRERIADFQRAVTIFTEASKQT